MKVEEAKQKICPFIQHMCLATGIGSHTMSPYAHININCIASDCMAFEYLTTSKDHEARMNGEDTPYTDGYCKRIGQ